MHLTAERGYRRYWLSVGLGIAVGWFLVGHEAYAAGSLQILLRSGESSPDGNGTFNGLGFPSLNDAGDLMFPANMAGSTSGVFDASVYVRSHAGSFEVIAREGQLTPDGTAKFDGFSESTMNSSGEIAFRLTLRYDTGLTLFHEAIYRSTPGSPLVEIIREGRTDPDGVGAFGDFPSHSLNLTESGEVVFGNSLTSGTGSAVEFGVFRGDGQALAPLARNHDLTPINGYEISHIYADVHANPSGAAVLGANLDDPNTLPEDESYAVFRADGTSLVPLVVRGQAAPDGNGTFFGASRPISISQSGYAAFFGQMADTAQGGTDDDGVFVASETEFKQIAREHQLLAEGGRIHSPLVTSGRAVMVNESGQVAFRARLKDTAGGTAEDRAIFWGDGSELVEIAREGDLAPGGDGRFFNFGQEMINNAGEVAFIGQVNQTASGEVESGLYVFRAGEIVPIVRVGQPLAGSTIESVVIHQNDHMQSRGFNNHGELAFWVELANQQDMVMFYSPSASLAGDYNADGIVNAADYSVWRDHAGSTVPLLNETASPGSVDAEDYLAWRANFGATSQVGGASFALRQVPEPATAWYLLMSLACCVRVRSQVLSSAANRTGRSR
jgi:hypothetical protein